MNAFLNRFRSKTGIAVVGAIVVATLVTVHEVKAHRAAAAAQAGGPMAMPVDVETILPAKVSIWSTFPGRMAPVDYAQIRPEVSGRITEIRFREGQIVKAGDVLMVIDPAPYEAAASKAQADLASAQSKAEFAKVTLTRSDALLKSNTISKQAYDQRVSDSQVADADVKSAAAQLALAQVDLGRAYVKAPISGKTSRAEITVGNLVQSGPTAPVLTSVVSNNGIYAEFDVDEQTYLSSIRTGGNGHAGVTPVELNIQGDNGHPYQGTIYSFDNHIDPTSGTIRARAKFADPSGALMPGMFVSVKVAQIADQTLVIVPQRAIGEDQSRKFVFVVSKDNKAEIQEVTLGPDAGNGNRVVTSGLVAGDRVIVGGVQFVRPDSPVAPNDVTKQLILAAAN